MNTADPELLKILERYGRLVSGVAHNLYVNEAEIKAEVAQQITRWAAKQELRGRIMELQRADIYAPDDFKRRLKELQQELDNG